TDNGSAGRLKPVLSESPTITSPAMTQAGTILGTAAYMSPEQAKGLAADKSCDVWAFACVLYEMLTGQRTFRGDGVTETLGNVLKNEPLWDLLPADTPPGIVTLLKRSLSKNRQQRITDIAVVQFLLDAPLEMPTTRKTPLLRRATAMIGLSAAALGVASVFWIATRFSTHESARTPTRYRVVPPPSVTALINPAGNASGQIVAWSADGRRLVYAARQGTGNTEWALFRRSSDELDSVQIEGTLENTAAGNTPFFSPDGEWVGFLGNEGKLLKIPYGGGKAIPICDLGSNDLFGATWLPNDSIVFANNSSGLQRISASGGTPTFLTKPDGKTEMSHRWPESVP